MRILILLAILALAGCSTVSSRIEERPEVFQRLPEKQKQLVTQGQIAEGMGQDAIYLAWGKPDSVTRGSERGREIEEWTYYGNRTEVVPSYRHVPIRYGRNRIGYDYVFDPIVVSSRYHYQSVRFENGKSVAWSRTPFAY